MTDRTVEIEITLTRTNRRRVAPAADLPRVPRTARLMALAIKFQGMVDRGEVQDYADLARLGYVTRARLTQIMNLLLLAPELQEALLFHEGTQALTGERYLRAVTSKVSWQEQRRLWRSIGLSKPV